MTARAQGVLLALAVVLVLVVAYQAAESRPVVLPEPGPRYVVRRDDTLWSIARRFYPEANPWQVIDRIKEINAPIDEGRLRIGRVLILPKEAVGR